MIAILSDFGSSEYLGIMKGVIYHLAEKANVVDLCNTIHPHNIKEGAWVLKQSYKFYPKNTIFLNVVDPGVGGERKGVIVKTKNFYFVGPDNGIMYPAINEDKIQNIVELSAGKNIASTFHGRDIFAVAAAKMEKGVEMSALGKKSKLKAKMDFSLDGNIGEIVRIDNFGNIITNIPAAGKTKYNVKCGKFNQELSLYGNYESAPEGKLFLVIGSANTLEISLKNSNANEVAKLEAGTGIEIS